MGRNKIIDEFTDLPVSKQRKHQLRNPEWVRQQRARWALSEKGQTYYKTYMKNYYRTKIKQGGDKPNE